MDKAPQRDQDNSAFAKQLLGKKPHQERKGAASSPHEREPAAFRAPKFDNVHHPEVYANVRKHVQAHIKSLGG